MLLTGAAGVPAWPVSVNVPFVTLIVPAPAPLTIVPAASAPPLTFMVPAVPGVTVPVTAARVSVLLTVSVALVPILTMPTPVPPLLTSWLPMVALFALTLPLLKFKVPCELAPGVAALAQLHRVRHHRDVAPGKIAKGGAGNLRIAVGVANIKISDASIAAIAAQIGHGIWPRPQRPG